jgi:aspartate ammonia-lyase
MKTRREIDPLGERVIPESAYYGIQTLRAIENFPVSEIKAPLPFIKAYVLLKEAAALANMEVGWLDQKIGKAIVQACEEILTGKWSGHFV